MKTPCVFLVLFTFSSLVSAQADSSKTLLIDSMINASSLRKIVEVLASDSMGGRFTGTSEAKKAAMFIAGEFRKAGAIPLTDSAGYFMAFMTRGEVVTVGMNVIAAFVGTSCPEETIIFSAHYDHVGTLSTNPFPSVKGRGHARPGDTIFNGANDDASGTSALIALARYFGMLGKNDRSIIFIAFAGEELGLLGSKYASANFHPENIKAMINIEMIGRPISRKRMKPYMTGANLSNLQLLMNQRLHELDEQSYGKNFFERDRFSSENLFARSDNYWFAMRGVPAHTIIGSSPEDDFYHSPADEATTLDYHFMANIVKGIALASMQFTHGRAAPSRIRKRNIPDRF